MNRQMFYHRACSPANRPHLVVKQQVPCREHFQGRETKTFRQALERIEHTAALLPRRLSSPSLKRGGFGVIR